LIFSGLITTTSTGIDRETIGNWLNITVTASDGGSPSRETNTTIEIQILDINDHDPVFNVSFVLLLRNRKAIGKHSLS